MIKLPMFVCLWLIVANVHSAPLEEAARPAEQQKTNATQKANNDGQNKNILQTSMFSSPFGYSSGYQTFQSAPTPYFANPANAYYYPNAVLPYMSPYSSPASYQNIYSSSSAYPFLRDDQKKTGRAAQPQSIVSYPSVPNTYSMPVQPPVYSMSSNIHPQPIVTGGASVVYPFSSGYSSFRPIVQRASEEAGANFNFQRGPADIVSYTVLPYTNSAPVNDIRRKDLYLDDRQNLNIKPEYLMDRVHALSPVQSMRAAAVDNDLLTDPSILADAQTYYEYDPYLSRVTPPNEQRQEANGRAANVYPDPAFMPDWRNPAASMFNSRQAAPAVSPYSHESIINDAVGRWLNDYNNRLTMMQQQLADLNQKQSDSGINKQYSLDDEKTKTIVKGVVEALNNQSQYLSSSQFRTAAPDETKPKSDKIKKEVKGINEEKNNMNDA